MANVSQQIKNLHQVLLMNSQMRTINALEVAGLSTLRALLLHQPLPSRAFRLGHPSAHAPRFYYRGVLIFTAAAPDDEADNNDDDNDGNDNNGNKQADAHAYGLPESISQILDTLV